MSALLPFSPMQAQGAVLVLPHLHREHSGQQSPPTASSKLMCWPCMAQISFCYSEMKGSVAHSPLQVNSHRNLPPGCQGQGNRTSIKSCCHFHLTSLKYIYSQQQRFALTVVTGRTQINFNEYCHIPGQ